LNDRPFPFLQGPLRPLSILGATEGALQQVSSRRDDRLSADAINTPGTTNTKFMTIAKTMVSVISVGFVSFVLERSARWPSAALNTDGRSG
jgi:hypothetical protein